MMFLSRGYILETTFITYGWPENASMSDLYNEINPIFRRFSNPPDFVLQGETVKEAHSGFLVREYKRYAAINRQTAESGSPIKI